jgi:membrane-associated PAP2 superfamily phosphatase
MQRISPRVRGLLIVMCLFGFSLAVTPALSDRDLDWTARFFIEGGPNGGWALGRQFPWGQLYTYGEIPPVMFVLCALALYMAARFGKLKAAYTRPCLVVILTVAIGPGMIVNGILKERWGRPRPVDIHEYGGASEYRKAWQPAGKGAGKSFTCGHCAMGFSVASGAAFYPLHPAAAIGSLVVGVSYGLLLGVARVAQGGHFPTDVLWSATVVFITLAVLYYIVLRVPEQVPFKPPPKR